MSNDDDDFQAPKPFLGPGWAPEGSIGDAAGPTWICELIAHCYLPQSDLDRSELGIDVNYCLQSFGGLRELPHQVNASDFNNRTLVRANDPQALQWVWSFSRRVYWAVYDNAPQFWQQQFSDRSLVATALVRMIVAIVLVNPQRTPSSQKLMAFFHTSNRPFANH